MSKEKPEQIQIPVEFFKTFIQASTKWLAKTNDAKKGLEMRLAQAGPDRLEFSVGGDSHFIRMVVATEPFDMPDPIWIDLSYFQNLSLDAVEQLTLIRPRESKLEDKRAQFKAPGMNFRIPLRSGETWKRNYFDPKDVPVEDSQKLLFERDQLDRIFPYWDLPDSFGAKTGSLLRLVVPANSTTLKVWSNDQFGAFCHEFQEAQEASGIVRSLKLQHSFLQPYRAAGWEYKVLYWAATDRLQIAEILPYREGPLLFQWIAPQQQGIVPDIEASLAKERSLVEHAIDFDTAMFCRNVERATSFYQDKDYKERPIELSMIGKQYSLVGRLPNSEMIAEGESLSAPEKNMKVMVQPRCLLDYTKRFERTAPLQLGIARQTAILSQKLEKTSLQY